MEEKVVGGIYRHFKSQENYRLEGTAVDTRHEDLVIVYKPLYPCPYELFTRPEKQFFGLSSEGVNRFSLMERPVPDTSLRDILTVARNIAAKGDANLADVESLRLSLHNYKKAGGVL